MSFSVFFDIAAALAVTAILAESYGFVRRKMAGTNLAPVVLGILFGLMALVQMFNPVAPFDGVILDMRNVPVALAGAFLGWRGLLPCLAIALATRYGIGGMGTLSGILGMSIAGMAGMIWARKMAHIEQRNLGMLLMLAVAMSSHLAAAFVFPRDVVIWFFTNAAIPIMMVNLVAVPLIGSLLERENRRIRNESRLAAAITHDPQTGLLTGAAFARDVADSYAAQSFGAFAGFLTIKPDGGLWSSVSGLIGTTPPAPIDACTLSEHVEHSALAAIRADHTVLIPITAWEVENISRVKSALREAMRNARGHGDTAGLVEMTLIEAIEPAEFVRTAERIAQEPRQDWNARPISRRGSGIVREEVKVRHSAIFNPEEHNILFAKADFLIDRSHG